jgi:hypothetical protein
MLKDSIVCPFHIQKLVTGIIVHFMLRKIITVSLSDCLPPAHSSTRQIPLYRLPWMTDESLHRKQCLIPHFLTIMRHELHGASFRTEVRDNPRFQVRGE